MKVSGCIIALNEENYIERAVNSLRQMSIIDDIVVVDGGSTDNTVSICKRLGCNVVVNPWPYDFSIQRNLASSLCAHDWIIVADADEWYPDEAGDVISAALSNIADNVACLRVLEASVVEDQPYGPPMSISVVREQAEIHGYDNFFMYEGKLVAITASTRVLNRTKGQWVDKLHEVFVPNDGAIVIDLSEGISINHQKDMKKQYISNARYDALQYDTCWYAAQFDDFCGGRSAKSVELLDEVFMELVTKSDPCARFIEAGAFNGETSRLVQRCLPNTNVYAFEANPYNYQHFKPLFADSNANYIHLALANHNNEVEFKVHTDIQGTTMPKIKGNDSLLSRSDEGVSYEHIKVKCTTLDDYFADNISCKTAMWIDLEGAAYEALLGASQLLKSVNVLKIEVEDRQFWENQKLSGDIIKLLSTHGFVQLMRDYEYDGQYNILFCKWQGVIESMMDPNSHISKFMRQKGLMHMRREFVHTPSALLDRRDMIVGMYRTLLKREPDQEGLNNYLYSKHTIKQIQLSIVASAEYRQLN